MIKNLISLAFILYASKSINAHNDLKGHNEYTGIVLGDMNILISAPHGGLLKPDNIEDRTATNYGDYNTLKFAHELRKKIENKFQAAGLTKHSPFLVYNELHRVKMDPNRDISVSCSNEIDDCRKAYNDFHGFISQYFMKDLMNTEDFEQGLLIDIHGQSHPEKWIELGYLLSANNLDSDNILSSKSSIRQISSLSSYNFEEIVRGNASFGSILQNYGLDTVPSPAFKSPNGGNYYSGGFITKTYGSKNCPDHRISAIQIELPYHLRKNSAYEKTGTLLANAIFEFYMLHGFDKILAGQSIPCV